MGALESDFLTSTPQWFCCRSSSDFKHRKYRLNPVYFNFHEQRTLWESDKSPEPLFFQKKYTFYTPNFSYDFKGFMDTGGPWTLIFQYVPGNSGLIKSPFHLSTKRCHSSASKSFPKTSSFFLSPQLQREEFPRKMNLLFGKELPLVDRADSGASFKQLSWDGRIVLSTITVKAHLEIKMWLKPTSRDHRLI